MARLNSLLVAMHEVKATAEITYSTKHKYNLLLDFIITESLLNQTIDLLLLCTVEGLLFAGL